MEGISDSAVELPDSRIALIFEQLITSSPFDLSTEVSISSMSQAGAGYALPPEWYKCQQLAFHDE
jgi:hypothetical protein